MINGQEDMMKKSFEQCQGKCGCIIFGGGMCGDCTQDLISELNTELNKIKAQQERCDLIDQPFGREDDGLNYGKDIASQREELREAIDRSAEGERLRIRACTELTKKKEEIAELQSKLTHAEKKAQKYLDAAEDLNDRLAKADRTIKKMADMLTSCRRMADGSLMNGRKS